MRRTIRPGLPAYLPLGLIVGGVVAIYSGAWVARGPQTGVWQPMLLFAAIYVVWALYVRSRIITISEKGLTLVYLFRPSKYVSWDEIGSSAVTYWMRRVPTQILIYGQSVTSPILTVPLGLYSRRDAEYLMSLKQLNVTL